MQSTLSLTSVFLVFLGTCTYAFSAGGISPRLADSPEAQRDRDLTLVGGGPASPIEHAKFLRALRDELRARLAVLDARIRESTEGDSALRTLRAEREIVFQNEKKTSELIKRFESVSKRG